jgi:hypothetical protein
MDIQRHPSCTHELGAPSDMQDGSCSALPVAYQETEYGTFALSFWKPDAAELAALNAGGAVVLGVRAIGRQHPVVFMTATPEATEPTASLKTATLEELEANNELPAASTFKPPEGVYYKADDDEFYDVVMGGLGAQFYYDWRKHRGAFPKSREAALAAITLEDGPAKYMDEVIG